MLKGCLGSAPPQYIIALNLASNRIGHSGAQHLGNAMSSTKECCRINVFHANIFQKTQHMSHHRTVPNSPKPEQPNLQMIDLSDNQIGDDGVTAIAEAMRSSPTTSLGDAGECGH